MIDERVKGIFIVAPASAGELVRIGTDEWRSFSVVLLPGEAIFGIGSKLLAVTVPHGDTIAVNEVHLILKAYQQY